jgi:hypothetical protein
MISDSFQYRADPEHRSVEKTVTLITSPVERIFIIFSDTTCHGTWHENVSAYPEKLATWWTQAPQRGYLMLLRKRR